MAAVTIQAVDVRAGDVWTSDKDDVLVHRVDLDLETGAVRVVGKITRGWGSGGIHTWSFLLGQSLDVIR